MLRTLAIAPSPFLMQRRAVVRALVCCATIALVACSGVGSGVPAETNARDALLAHIAKVSDSRVKLISFNKTNGIPTGENRYSIAFDSEIEYTDEAYAVYADDTDGGNWQASFKARKPPEPGNLMASFSLPPGRNMKKGDRAVISGEIPFQMTEKGWQVADSGPVVKQGQFK